MKALIIQHETITPPGSTLEWLKLKGIDYKIHFFSDGNFSENENFDLLIICGGSQNVDQEAEFPWLTLEKAFIQQAIKDHKKIVGLCLGGQLLAESLGGSVFKAPQWEIGWQKIKLLETHSELMVFQWHGYQFISPPDSIKIAENAVCPHQGFKFGSNIMAFQFHPESTVEWVRECADDPELPARDHFVQDRNEMLTGMPHQKIMQEWYFNLLDSILL